MSDPNKLEKAQKPKMFRLPFFLVLAFLLQLLLAFLVVAPRRRPLDEPFEAQAIRSLNLRTKDGLTIAAIYSPAGPFRGTPCERAAVLLHGLGDRKESQLGYMQGLAQLGIPSVAIDLRGHGDSDGFLLRYGRIEYLDVQAAVDWLSSETGATRFSVLGISYSGGAATEAATRDSRIDQLALVSTYASLPDLLPDYAKQIFGHRLPRWFTQWVLAEASLLSTSDLMSVDPAAALRRTQAKILVIHSRDDQQISIRHGERLADSARVQGSLFDFVELHQVGHNESVGAFETIEAVSSFFAAADSMAR